MAKERRITIKDIAKLAGVSVGAVSTAFSNKKSNVLLSEATRKKILQIAQENNYIPNIAAKAMQSRKSYLLGFFYRAENSYLQSGILKGIRSICRKYDYDIIVYPCDSLTDERYYLESLHVNSLDGIITIPIKENGQTNEELYRNFAQRGIPVIQVLFAPWQDLPMIGRNYPEIAKKAIQLLVEGNHQHIGFLTFENYNNPLTSGNNYLLTKVLIETAQKANLKLDIYTLPTGTKYEEYIKEANWVMEKVISNNKSIPSALVTASSRLAYGAYSCFNNHNIKVPEDVSILACGEDCEDLLIFNNKLSYFPVELEEIGKLSAQYCFDTNSLSNLQTFVDISLPKGNTLVAKK